MILSSGDFSSTCIVTLILERSMTPHLRKKKTTTTTIIIIITIIANLPEHTELNNWAVHLTKLDNGDGIMAHAYIKRL